MKTIDFPSFASPSFNADSSEFGFHLGVPVRDAGHAGRELHGLRLLRRRVDAKEDGEVAHAVRPRDGIVQEAAELDP
eukprot:5697017-Alexandrium_andersonii.AAC.1